MWVFRLRVSLQDFRIKLIVAFGKGRLLCLLTPLDFALWR